MDAAELDLLRTAPGRALLAAAVAGLDVGEDVLALATGLRRGGSDPDLVGSALTQARLRVRARVKFGPDADRMYWTAEGLEQATRGSVARHRAGRYAAFGAARVADLCCGVGGDLTALARAGLPVLGIDSDPLTAAVARANAEELGLADLVDVRVGAVEAADLSGCDAALLDPARRSSGRRRFDPEGYSPPYSYALALAARLPATGLKVAPGIPHDLVPPDAEAEWVSVDGDVKEAALWFGPLTALPGRRRATLLTERSGATGEGAGDGGAVTLVDDPSLPAPLAAPAGRYLHEPDGAVIRAGLVAEVAAGLDGWLLDPTIAYVSTDSDARSPFTRTYLVEEVVPFQLKRLRALLRERGVGDVIVKKRGTAVEPEELRRRLRLDGDGPTRTLILTRVAGAPIVLLADPVA